MQKHWEGDRPCGVHSASYFYGPLFHSARVFATSDYRKTCKGYLKENLLNVFTFWFPFTQSNAKSYQSEKMLSKMIHLW